MIILKLTITKTMLIRNNTKTQKKDYSKAKKAIDNANKANMFGTISN